LSKGIEAFISRMIAEGPAAKRPPHIAFAPSVPVMEESPLLSSRSLKLFGPVCAAACAISLAGCDRKSETPAQPPVDHPSIPAPEPTGGTLDSAHKGDPLPSVTVKDAKGQTLAIASLKGKPVLINLWATWCAPCVAELPTLDRLAAAKGDQLRVLTVSQDLKPERVPDFLKGKGGTHLPAWLDPETALSFKYQVQTLPTSILYDAAGKEVWRFTGNQDWTGPKAAQMLADGGVK
jgi:thiol-disulfide isomerase/thioredoxin